MYNSIDYFWDIYEPISEDEVPVGWGVPIERERVRARPAYSLDFEAVMDQMVDIAIPWQTNQFVPENYQIYSVVSGEWVKQKYLPKKKEVKKTGFSKFVTRIESDV